MNLSQFLLKVNIDMYAPNLPGVYIMGSDALDSYVYVGRTLDIQHRLGQHCMGESRESWLINCLHPDWFEFVVLWSHEERVCVESWLKKRLDPLYDQIRREIRDLLN